MKRKNIIIHYICIFLVIDNCTTRKSTSISLYKSITFFFFVLLIVLFMMT